MTDEPLYRSGMTRIDPPYSDYERGVIDAWNAVDAIIRRGPLPEPQHSERNGMVLAANQIMALRYPKMLSHG